VTDAILFERRGGLGVATLNRPKALNALTLDMIRAFDRQLDAWGPDSTVRAIVLRGEGRAFCAGGDVRLVRASRHDPPGPGDYKTELFTEEFRLIRRLHRFPKPWIALTHGITMGGGAGLSVNGSHCVVSEDTVFAMPEVFIGSFPDVAATRFLARTPGRIGLYLSLTGARADAADSVHLGFSHHLVPQARFDEITEALAGNPGPVERVLASFAVGAGPSRLAALQPRIDRCFGQGSVEEIVAALRQEPGDWAEEALAAMGRASPLSLKLAFRLYHLGADLDIEGALTLEFRVMQHVLAGDDFYEGVRAVLVDKDQKPRWRSSLPGAAEVDRHFQGIGERELRL
jgi:enoyl-CoA hydratase